MQSEDFQFEKSPCYLENARQACNGKPMLDLKNQQVGLRTISRLHTKYLDNFWWVSWSTSLFCHITFLACPMGNTIHVSLHEIFVCDSKLLPTTFCCCASRCNPTVDALASRPIGRSRDREGERLLLPSLLTCDIHKLHILGMPSPKHNFHLTHATHGPCHHAKTVPVMAAEDLQARLHGLRSWWDTMWRKVRPSPKSEESMYVNCQDHTNRLACPQDQDLISRLLCQLESSNYTTQSREWEDFHKHRTYPWLITHPVIDPSVHWPIDPSHQSS